ncbi:MAG: hypothetical protein GX359_09085 [Clostridiales bacterium]|nr:hypothetical protein [Clostridiales bacterium]
MRRACKFQQIAGSKILKALDDYIECLEQSEKRTTHFVQTSPFFLIRRIRCNQRALKDLAKAILMKSYKPDDWKENFNGLLRVIICFDKEIGYGYEMDEGATKGNRY